MPIIIQQIELQTYCLKFQQPFKTAQGVIGDRTCCIIKVITEQGQVGIGEAAPLPEFGMETFSATQQALQDMQSILVGQKISNCMEILEFLAGFSHTPAARHGMELALLDVLAKFHQQPLAYFLNRSANSTVLVNAVIGAVSPEVAREMAQKFVRQNYACLKVKVGDGDLDQDWQRVSAVRAAIGNHIKIRLDANQAWSVTEAILRLKKLETLNIEYIEQPVAAEDLVGMNQVRRATNIAIAADEAVKNVAELHSIIKHKVADIVILKPMCLGGLLIAQQAANIAFEANLDVVITTTLDGAIARLGSLHLAASLPKIQRACGLATGNLFAVDLPYQVPIPNLGKLKLPNRPGLGYALKV